MGLGEMSEARVVESKLRAALGMKKGAAGGAFRLEELLLDEEDDVDEATCVVFE